MKNLVYEEYSQSREYKMEIYLNDNIYETCILYRETDEYMGRDWFQYIGIDKMRHFSDTLDRAIEIGRECLRSYL